MLNYYQELDRVRTAGDFEGWMLFYLTAIRDSAKDGYKVRAKDTTIGQVSQATGKAYNTIRSLFKAFEALGVVVEQTLYKRNKVYRFESYLAHLEKAYS